MVTELLNFILEGILTNINFVYFIAMLLIPEFIKEFTYYNPNNRTRWFKLDKKKRFRFRMKKLVLFLGLVLGILFYYFDILMPVNTEQGITQLIITYIIVTTMYDLLFTAIIKKFRDVLKTVGDAKIKPMEISLINDFDSQLDDCYYGDELVEDDIILEDDIEDGLEFGEDRFDEVYQSKRKEIQYKKSNKGSIL